MSKKNARPSLAGLETSVSQLDAVNVHNASCSGVHKDLEAVAMTTAKIGEGAPLALKSAHAIKSAVADDRPSFGAADTVGSADQAVAVPIGLRIPEAAKMEAELIIFMAATLVPIGIIFPI